MRKFGMDKNPSCLFTYRSVKLITYFSVMMLVFLLLTACEKEPLKIGFVADISSGNSQVAVDARNGVEYYINQVNDRGGVKGRLIELVVKDHRGDDDTSMNMHKEFINEDVHFVIGDLLSNKAETLLESNNQELLFVTPTMSTDKLSDLDDFIIRTAPINSGQADEFFAYAKYKKAEDMLVVYDLLNQEYTESLAKRVQSLYQASDLSFKGIIPFDSTRDDLSHVAQIIVGKEPKNVLFLSSSSNTARLIQLVKKDIEDLGLYSVSWSMTNDFIENGGQAVKGTTFVGVFDPEFNSPEYVDFTEGFSNYYGYDPTFVSVLAYDAVKALVEGIKEADQVTPQGVKEAILKQKVFSGLREDFSIDEFGDNNRQYMMYILEGEAFVALRDWK